MYACIYDILPSDEMEDLNYDLYSESEKAVLEPALKARGYLIISAWWSLERDSFGPLFRSVKAIDPGGQHVTLWYG